MSRVIYQVLLAKSVSRELQRLPTKMQERIIQVLDNLQFDPRPKGSKKIVGNTALWRVRSGDYRVIYEIDDKNRIVDVNAVRHRSDAYR